MPLDLQLPIAVIDMGSNTFHLLIGQKTEQQPVIVYKEKVGVKLAFGGISQGVLAPDAMRRGLNCLSHFQEKCRQYNVPRQNIIAVATSAVRSAENKDSFIEAVEQITGIKTIVISGDTEADYIFKGVCEAIEMDNTPFLLMDIGGGSVEFIIGNSNGISWKKSIEIGGQRLMDKFMTSDPISEKQVTALNEYLQAQLAEVITMAKVHNVKTILGSSGTFDSLCEIYERANGHEAFNMDHQKASNLPIDSFEQITLELIKCNRAERLAIPGMVELRVDMIVVASILIQYVLQTLLIKEIKVSNYSLKQGVFFSVMKGEALNF